MMDLWAEDLDDMREGSAATAFYAELKHFLFSKG